MKTLNPKFLKEIPETLEEGIIYISMDYATAIHKCACGCGKEVVTPLSSTGWVLIFNGEAVTLDPSIGNWNFPCQSHYWIKNNKIIWAPKWNNEQIKLGRALESLQKKNYYKKSLFRFFSKR